MCERVSQPEGAFVREGACPREAHDLSGMALVWGRLFGHPSFQRLTAMVIDDNNDFSRALTAIRKPTINLGVFPNDIDRALRGFSGTAELVRS